MKEDIRYKNYKTMHLPKKWEGECCKKEMNEDRMKKIIGDDYVAIMKTISAKLHPVEEVTTIVKGEK